MKKGSSIRVQAASIAASAAILIAAYWLPGATSERNIQSESKSPRVHVLAKAGSIEQSFVVDAGTYTGAAIFADTDVLGSRHIVAEFIPENSSTSSKSTNTSTSYLGDDMLKINLFFPPIVVNEKKRATVRITLQDGEDLPILVAEDPEDDRFALTIIQPDRFSFGARQGMVAASIFILGIGLISSIRKKRWQYIAAALLIAIITPVALAGYWFSTGDLGISDWDYYFSLHHYWRNSIVNYHEFPQWNPYTCGGTAAIADPEFSVFTPSFIFELLFDIPVGIRLAIYTSVIVGAWGMLALGKRLGLSVYASLLAALAVAFGTVNLLEVTEGHQNIFSAMWIPWIFWAWQRVYTLKTKISYIVLGAFLGITFLQGGIYLLMYTSLAFLALPFLVRNHLAAWKASIVGGLWGFGFASFKIIPVLLWLRQFPDEAYASSAYTLPWLVDVLFGRHLHGEYVIFAQNSGWHEYGAYIGYVVLACVVIALSRIIQSRTIRALTITAIIAIFLSSLGPQLRPYFDLMSFFPRSNISRFILFAIVPLALLSGVGLDVLRGWIKRVHGGAVASIVAVLIIGIAAADIFSLSYQLSEQAFVLPKIIPEPTSPPYPIAFTMQRFDEQGAGTRTTRGYQASRAGWGVFTYCSVLGPAPLVRTIHDEGDNGILLVTNREGHYDLVHWSPNKVITKIHTPGSTNVILNTNYALGWYVNDEPATVIDGRVGVTIEEAGEHEVVFAYRTPGLVAGCIISVGTLLAAWYTTRRGRHKHM